MILRTILFAAIAMVSCPAFELPLDIACCPAPPPGQVVVNADQTVLIIWDPVSKMEHFIRQASFKAEADDFGFLIPSPAQPELDESVNATFPFLKKLTEPEIVTKTRWVTPSYGCGEMKTVTTRTQGTTGVHVLEEKIVAGFHAMVLEASTAGELAKWLTEKGFALSPEVEGWAKPYVDANWKITALKVAKQAGSGSRIDAPALRLSFKTDRPLFPYREPDYKKAASLTKDQSRLLRIYFIGDARYQGDLTPQQPWTGKAVWSNKLDSDSRKHALDALKLPEASVPATWWLTEFEDPWPYSLAPADVYFSPDANQSGLKRPPIIYYRYATIPIMEGTLVLFLIAFVGVVIWRLRKRSA